MSKNLTNAASAALGTSSYETPAINIVEVHSEGVLCGSTMDTALSVERWEEDTFTW